MPYRARDELLTSELGTGGESGILLPPLPASHGETCTCGIIAGVCAGYKRVRSWAGVSTVSLIRYDSGENGITGISLQVELPEWVGRHPSHHRAASVLDAAKLHTLSGSCYPPSAFLPSR